MGQPAEGVVQRRCGQGWVEPGKGIPQTLLQDHLAVGVYHPMVGSHFRVAVSTVDSERVVIWP